MLAEVIGEWWLILPIVLTAVTFHVGSLLLAFRRVIDVWSLIVLASATVFAWSLSSAMADVAWPAAGAAAAGMCIGYVLAMGRSHRTMPQLRSR